MKIATVTTGNPLDLKTWSGSAWSICNAIGEFDGRAEFVYCKYLNLIASGFNRVFLWCGASWDIKHTGVFSRVSGLYFSIRLWMIDPDVIVCIASSAALSHLNTKKTIIYISDTTFRSIVDLYPRYRRYPRWLSKSADRAEARSLAKASIVVYPSNSARAAAMEGYGTPSDRIIVTPFGPNLSAEILPVECLPKSLPTTGPLLLLFVAVDWDRKGGEVVLETIALLNRRGVAAKVLLVGDIPDHVKPTDTVEVVGFLRKTDPASLKKLLDLLRQAHFFMLPTRADCYPIVFSEAQAFGCPSLTFDVGGAADAMRDGQLGVVLPLGAPASAFADAIETLIADPEAYTAMSAACRRNYVDNANWPTFVSRCLQAATATETSRPRTRSWITRALSTVTTLVRGGRDGATPDPRDDDRSPFPAARNPARW